jgi:hypothetical protein
MFKTVLRLLLVIMCSSPAFAHEGFNTVLNDVSVKPYMLTVLEDTHIVENQGRMNLMIQVAHGREAAPADTNVWLRLEHDNTLEYNDLVKYVGSSSSDGRTFYAYYIVNIPMAEMGIYQAHLKLDGPLGTAKTSFQFEAKATPELRAVEFIPSLLIISICLGGLLLFFLSTRTPRQKDTHHQKGLSHV